MKMKKLISLGMAMVLSLGLVACSGGEDKEASTSSTSDNCHTFFRISCWKF